MDVTAEGQALLQVDAAFSQASVDLGQAKAFRQFADEHAITLGNPDFIIGRNAIFESRKGAAPGTQLSWTPQVADVGPLGDLGFTIGNFVFRSLNNGQPVFSYGKYLTVWQRSPDGVWKCAGWRKREPASSRAITATASAQPRQRGRSAMTPKSTAVCLIAAGMLAGGPPLHAQIASNPFPPWHAESPRNDGGDLRWVRNAARGTLEWRGRASHSHTGTGLLIGALVGAAATTVFLVQFCGDPDTACQADEVGRAVVIIGVPITAAGALIGYLIRTDR